MQNNGTRSSTIRSTDEAGRSKFAVVVSHEGESTNISRASPWWVAGSNEIDEGHLFVTCRRRLRRRVLKFKVPRWHVLLEERHHVVEDGR